jgi:hypothetical protein
MSNKTTRPIVTIHNSETHEIIEREMNDAEFLHYQQVQAELLSAKAETEAKATARQAILDRLGLTVDELKTILG